MEMNVEYYIYRKDNGKPDLIKNIKYRATRKLQMYLADI
jgi:hypothetical protein